MPGMCLKPTPRHRMTRSIRLTGKTYPIRRELKAMGAHYDRGVWYVPREREGEAKSLLTVGLARHNAGRKHGTTSH